jgi:DNA-binding MarR family transcriptional regulator
VRVWDGYHHSDDDEVTLHVYNEVESSGGDTGEPLIGMPEPAVVGIGAAAAALVAVSFTGIGYYFLLSLIFPLYSKLRGKRITDQRTRSKLIEYLMENPGTHFSMIKKQLKLPNGSAGYHLRVLETAGFVKSSNDGFRKRFYPYGYKVPEFSLDGAEVRIVEIIGSRPGITQAELARRLKVTQPAIAYHVKALKDKGVVVTVRGGGTRLTNDYLGILNSDRINEKPEVGKPLKAPADSKR